MISFSIWSSDSYGCLLLNTLSFSLLPGLLLISSLNLHPFCQVPSSFFSCALECLDLYSSFWYSDYLLYHLFLAEFYLMFKLVISDIRLTKLNSLYTLELVPYWGMGSNRSAVGLLDTIKMESFRTILPHTYPYPHEHSRHAITAVVLGCLFFISFDNMNTFIQGLDSNIKWWSMYFCLFGFFYFFSSPFIGKTIKPSYSNFSKWWVLCTFCKCILQIFDV